MQNPIFVFLFSFFLLSHPSFSQNTNYPQNYFRPPLDIPLYLSGNFGEIRPNHFHSGLDIRTQEVEGKKVYAIADGYISRIRVSAFGFGYALYITHPNGYTSVYGHLKKYNDEITNYIKKIQYAKESFEQDIFPHATELPVKKGDIIALSGSTGGSAGPHLHFEIRDSKTETTINPQLFGFTIADKIPPVITQIIIYPLDNNSRVNGKNIPQKFNSASLVHHSSSPPPIIYVSGKIGFGIATYDTEDNSSNRNGVYSIELNADEQTVYQQQLEKFSFNETHYVNAHIDYEEKIKSHVVYQKSFLLPNDKMSIYKNIKNRGIMNFTNEAIHSLEYVVKDIHDNVSRLNFKVQSSQPPITNHQSPNLKSVAVFPYEKKNIYQANDIKIEIPINALYDTLYFEYAKSIGTKTFLSLIHHIHHIYTPLHLPYILSIKLNQQPLVFNSQLFDKALIVLVNEKGGIIHAEGGTYENGSVTASVRTFGNFAVVLDTVAPTIKLLTKNIQNSNTIKFKISDNLSGIKSYRATVDGKWLLMELDGKTGVLTYYFDEHIGKGKHLFRLVVVDNKDNAREYTVCFN